MHEISSKLDKVSNKMECCRAANERDYCRNIGCAVRAKICRGGLYPCSRTSNVTSEITLFIDIINYSTVRQCMDRGSRVW